MDNIYEWLLYMCTIDWLIKWLQIIAEKYLYEDATISGEGLQNLGFFSVLTVF